MKRFFLSRKLDRILIGLGSPRLAAAGFQGQPKTVLHGCVGSWCRGQAWQHVRGTNVSSIFILHCGDQKFPCALSQDSDVANEMNCILRGMEPFPCEDVTPEKGVKHG